jgi:hypothetical protein
VRGSKEFVKQTKQWNVDAFKNSERVQKYQQEIQTRLNKMDRQDDRNRNNVNHTWEGIRTVVQDVAGKIIGERRRKRNSKWFDEKCEECIKKKNEARQKILQKETRKNCESYHEMRKAPKKICAKKKKKKKKEWMKRQIEDIKLLDTQNERRKLYKAIDKLKKGYQPRVEGCRNRGGKMLYNEEEINNRWVEHFKGLLNKEREPTVVLELQTGVTADGDNEQHKIYNSRNEYSILDNVDMEQIAQTPTQQEVVKCIMKLKNNKVPGEDNIVAEMIKCGGEILNRRIYELICRMWQNEEIPDRWRMGIICPIFKKGDQFTYSNYRGIALLNVVYKVFSSMLNQRLKVIAELIVGEYQVGFHERKSTIDQIFVLKWKNFMNLGWTFICCSLTTNMHSTALIELNSLL